MNGTEVVLYKSRCAHHVAKHYIDKSITSTKALLLLFHICFELRQDLLAQIVFAFRRAVDSHGEQC